VVFKIARRKAFFLENIRSIFDRNDAVRIFACFPIMNLVNLLAEIVPLGICLAGVPGDSLVAIFSGVA
jgi:hypothetical protein